MAGDSKAFTFELEESLYFEKGQEVAELRGIALEPEISIQPYEEYISIRGNIELQGEYEKVASAEGERSPDFEDFQAKRYMERVIDGDGDELTAFSHRFPVEISVPPYRVIDLNEVTVHVESFDYEIPEPSHLKLYATIEIHGINSEVENPRHETEEVEENEHVESEAVVSDNASSEPDSFSFEIRNPQEAEAVVTESLETELDGGSIEQQQVEEEEVEVRAEAESVELAETEEVEVRAEADSVELVETEEVEVSADADSVKNEEVAVREALEPEQVEEVEEPEIVEVRAQEEKQAENDPDRWKKKSQTLAEFFNQLSDVEAEAADTESEEVEEQVYEEDVVTSEIDETEVYEEREPEDASLLSDIFRETKEEQYTKMRLCIVQNQDTIESIAERFSISPLQLIKQNQLEDDFEVHEGQLLYIPVHQ